MTSKARILLVEDNLGDQRLTVEALRDAVDRSSLAIVSDGVEALSYLRQRDNYADAERPSLIILDLNLPRKDGREVLAEIKQDRDLKCIPVVVLTTSKADEDIWRSYDYHANCYITKPVDLEQFFSVVKAIEHFWLTVVELPAARY